MGTRVAPIFAVSDMAAALAYYRGLGFGAREWHGGGYGFLTFEGVEIHLGVDPDLGKRPDRRATAYLFVEDADALARAWLAAGAEVRSPEDTEWGQHEGVLIDPDGNMIRFGSPMPRASRLAAGRNSTRSQQRSARHREPDADPGRRAGQHELGHVRDRGERRGQ